MNTLREFRPTRRSNRKECKLYTSYLDTLREDFNKRCGYCNDLDSYRIRSYTIDHFVPQNPEGFTHSIPPNYYYNLVYSCRYCNSSKTNKWPTLDASISNNSNEGFIDPVDAKYDNILIRNSSGKIIPADVNCNLTNYIIKELGLWLPIHELMWKLEKLKELNHQLTEILESGIDDVLKGSVKEYHYEILIELNKIQNNIFVEYN